MGFRVIPVSDEKRPAIYGGGGWKQYQESQTVQDVERLFAQDCYGIAILTGVSGLEVIDIDTKYDITGSLAVDYMKEVDDFKTGVNFHNCTVVQTQSGGYHVFYRCSEIEGNKKLASRPATPEELEKFNSEIRLHNDQLAIDQAAGARLNEKSRNEMTDPKRLPSVLIETRGVGGYVVAYPTPGYRIDIGKMAEVPTITREQRNVFINVAKSFNEIVEESRVDRQKRKVESVPGTQTTPWDAYDEKADVVQLLETYGWKNCYARGDKTYLRRPGKSDGGPSGNYSDKHKRFYCFSTSTEFEAEKAYSPTAVLAILKYGGDMSKAASELYREGYGDRYSGKPTQVNINQQQPQQDVPEQQKPKFNALDFLIQRQIKIHEKPGFNCDDLSVMVDGEQYPIAGLGMFGLVSGREKSRKTTLLTALVAAGVGSKNVLGFDLNLHGKKSCWIDTEQPEFFAWLTHKRLLNLAGYTAEKNTHRTFGLRDATPAQRVACIDALIESEKNLGLVIIDGALDLVFNMNDIEETQRVAQKFMEWTKKSGALIMTVIHENRGEHSNTIGHLGSFLSRKCDFNIQTVSQTGEEFTTVRAKAGRTKPFKNFDFTQDSEGFAILDFNHPADLPEGVSGGRHTPAFDPNEPPKEMSPNLTANYGSKNGVDDGDIPF